MSEICKLRDRWLDRESGKNHDLALERFADNETAGLIHFLFGLITFCVFFCLTGCNSKKTGNENPQQHRLKQVYVVNYPLEYLANRIAGDSIKVVFPLSSEQDPTRWKPKSETIIRFQNADLILLNGAGYSKWLVTVSLPESKLIDTSSGFRSELIELQDSFIHKHGPQGSQSDKELAAVTWLDLQQAKQQAAAIKDAFSELEPNQETMFAENFAALATDLDQLDRQFVEVAAQLGSTPMISSSPVYQYVARRYQLNLSSLSWRPESVPNDKDLTELGELLQTHPAKVMIWPTKPAAETVKLLQEKFKIKSYVMRIQAARTAGEPDWLANLKENLTTLKRIKSDLGSP